MGINDFLLMLWDLVKIMIPAMLLIAVPGFIYIIFGKRKPTVGIIIIGVYAVLLLSVMDILFKLM